MIKIEQTLHGYENGHQLLAASIQLPEHSRRIMDELSDLAGRSVDDEKYEYYSGYPILGGGMYVIAKTWHADEMSRPGCVWTHSFIISIEDMGKIKNPADILRLFARPKENDYVSYSKTLVLNENQREDAFQWDEMRLWYIVNAVFGSGRNTLVVLDDLADNYIMELLLSVFLMLPEVLKRFTFSTLSYMNRMYDSKEFSFQMVSSRYYFINAENYKRHTVFYGLDKNKSFPYWVKMCTKKMLDRSIQEVHNFIRLYGEEYCRLEYYNIFARLFFALNSGLLTLQQYFDAISQVIPDKERELYQQTVSLLLDDLLQVGELTDWEIEMMKMTGLKKIKLNDRQQYKISKNIAQKPEKLYALLSDYIKGDMNQQQKNMMEDVVKRLKPSDLKKVSRMQENICIVLIYLNRNLLLSEDIWKESRRFQQQMIYAGKKQNELLYMRKLLQVIIKCSCEDLSEDLYQQYGDIIIKPLFYIVSRESSEDGYLKVWDKILLKDEQYVLNHIASVKSKCTRVRLFLSLNTYNRNLIQAHSAKYWQNIYTDFIQQEEEHDKKLEYALHFLPVILCHTEHFQDNVIKDVVGVIYSELKSDLLEYDKWNRFQYLLPEVEPCKYWDKCLRMREAMRQRGYNTEILESKE